MARSSGSNTGRGNYPAANVRSSFGELKKGLQSVPKKKFPNKHMTTTQYKRGLKKVEEGSE